jgi:hypothetical protein
LKTLAEHNDTVLEKRRQERKRTGVACDSCGCELMIDNAPAKPAPFDPALVQVPVKCDSCDKVKYMYFPRVEWAYVRMAD